MIGGSRRAIVLLGVLLLALSGCAASPSTEARLMRLAREADTHYHAGKLSDARVLYEQILSLNPKSASAHVRIGSIHYRQGRSREARHEFEKAISIDPLNATAKFNLAVLDLNEAAQLLKDYIELSPRPANHGQALDLLGALREMQKEHRTAAARR